MYYMLSVDSTAKTATACISKSDGSNNIFPVAKTDLFGALTHSETLLPMIDSCLKLANLSIGDISVFAASTGPGSFTGVRIGVSVIKGLAFAKRPDAVCIPVSTLAALAENISNYGEGTVLCPCMDARREQLYNALFEVHNGKPIRLCGDRITTTKELYEELSSDKYKGKKIIINGDGGILFMSHAKEYSNARNNDIENCNISLCHPKDLFQDSFSVACCANEIFVQSDFDRAKFREENFNPSYLRLSQAERERNEKIKKGEKSC